MSIGTDSADCLLPRYTAESVWCLLDILGSEPTIGGKKRSDAGETTDADTSAGAGENDDEFFGVETSDYLPELVLVDYNPDPTPLTGLQSTLIELASAYLTPELSAEESAQPLPVRLETVLKKQAEFKKLLEQEKNDGVFGPATKLAYKQFVAYLEKQTTSAITSLNSRMMSIPAGAPISLPRDIRPEMAGPVSPDLFRSMVAAGMVKAKIDVSCDNQPTADDLSKLDTAFGWLVTCSRAIKEADSREEKSFMNGVIAENGLPPGWRYKEGDDFEAWKAAASEMIDLSLTTKGYIGAMLQCYVLGAGDKFPLQLPIGCKLTFKGSDNKEFVATHLDINDPGTLAKIKTAKLIEIDLGLPKDLKVTDPTNAETIRHLVDWINDYGRFLVKQTDKLAEIQQDPNKLLMYGDVELRNTRGVFDQNGKLISLIRACDVGQINLPPGCTARAINLLSFDFTAEKVIDHRDVNYGKIKVVQRVTAEQLPVLAYSNVRLPWEDSVGQPTIIESYFDPDEFVPIRNGSIVELRKASSLPSIKSAQRFNYWLDKGLTAVVDLGMVATGTIQARVAINGAKLAAAGATDLQLTAGQKIFSVASNGGRIAIGGAGVFNNAGAREESRGELLNKARGVYFLCDIALGVARVGKSVFSPRLPGAPPSAAEKISATILGRGAADGVPKLDGIPYIRNTYKGTMYSFKAAELGFAKVVWDQLCDSWSVIKQDGNKFAPIGIPRDTVGDGRGLVMPPATNAFDPRVSSEILSGYADTLCTNRTPDKQQAIRKIFEQVSSKLESTPEEKAELCQQLAMMLTFSPDEIRQLEQLHPEARKGGFTLTQEMIADLMDPDKRRNLPGPVAKLAESIMASRDQDLLAAARIGLLYLNRDGTGKINESLASVAIQIESYPRTVAVDNVGRVESKIDMTIPARTLKVSFSTASIVKDLQIDLSERRQTNRGIVTGDVLLRIGALSHRAYGCVLRDVLNDPTAPAADKMRALTDPFGSRMAVIADGAAIEEYEALVGKSTADAAALAKSFGVTSTDFVATLENTAKTDPAPEVRAMSAALLFGLRQSNPQRKAEMLTALNSLWQEMKDKPQNFVEAIETFLQRAMARRVPSSDTAGGALLRESRLNAAMSLLCMTRADDSNMNDLIIRSIADTVDRSDFVATNRALELLLPDRIKQLPTQVQNKLFQELALMIKRPDNGETDDNLIRLLNNLKKALPSMSVEVKDQFSQRLEGLLTADSPTFAKYFPETRVAAIELLVRMKGPNLNIFRALATAEPTLQIGTTSIRAGESDGRVRAAALRALAELNDPYLDLIAEQIISKETDPKVAEILRTVIYERRPIAPEIYADRYQDALKLQVQRDSCAPCSEKEAKEFLASECPLLDKDTFIKALQKGADSGSSWVNFQAGDRYGLDRELNEALRVRAERQRQFENLCKIASDPNHPQARKAIMSLYYIATGAIATHVGIVSIDSPYKPGKHTHRIESFDVRSEAANHFMELAKSASKNLDLVAYATWQALENPNLPISTRDQFLQTQLRLAGQERPGGTSLSKPAVAGLLMRMLLTDLARPEPSISFQRKVIDELTKLNCREAVPIVQAVLDNPKNQAALSANQSKYDVRAACEKLVFDVGHNLAKIWNESSGDTKSTAEQRIERLNNALKSGNEDVIVRELFNSFKEYTFSGATDRGLQPILAALRSTSERVRLASAMVLLKDGMSASNLAHLEALNCLLKLETGSKCQWIRKQAREFLRPPMTVAS